MEKFPNPHKDNHRAESEAANKSLHDSDLYDQDEDKAGERIDPATGKSIDNSTYTGMEDLSVVDDTEEPKLTGQALDEAERWLQENDPDYGK